MSRKPNPQIVGFGERVQWIVDNLDPDPAYARFISEPSDVYQALASAIDHGRYHLHSGFGDTAVRKTVITRRWWDEALRTDSVSPHFVHWLCDLFVDLDREHLLAPDMETFLRVGLPIKTVRRSWVEPAQFYSRERKALHAAAMAFYKDVQSHDLDKSFAIPFPLLVRPGWIRASPLMLAENTEAPFLEEPAEFRPPRHPPRLPGLSGAYSTYRGKLGFPKRRTVRLEPQHNGEIFCARNVVRDGEGFVGFRYDLGLYFDYIDTCEVLGAELAKWAIDFDCDTQRLPPKFDLRGAPEDAYDIGNRAAYPGVNCLTIFLNYDEQGRRALGDWVLLHKRDETQLQAQNTLHVVPAGGHQAFAKGAQREDAAIWRTAVREFAEELFNKESLSKQSETWSDFVRHPDVARIKDLFFDGTDPAARMFLYGFGLDPITLKPEILCTIIIDWAKVRPPRPALKFNWELQTPDPKVTRHQWVRLSRNGLIREATERRQSMGDRALDMLPAGAACLLLTAKHFARLGLSEGAAE